MAKPTVSLPQGTRDFGPDVVRKRQYIMNTIRSVFELYGFQPLETPAMENIDTLMGKYGDEGDKLIFKVLNNGLTDPDNAEKAKKGFESVLAGKNDKDLTARALRYDLTIPFARFVAMNQSQISFPFKRYQIQPVWRADRPQKGRYREFYQCDADVVGSKSLLNEVELAAIYSGAFSKLGVDVEIRINNRKILAALADTVAAPEKLTSITIAIDKLDKIGMDKVLEELTANGLDESQALQIRQFLEISGSNEEKVNALKEIMGANELGAKGIEEMEYVLNLAAASKVNGLLVDLTLARGLNYYTGTIFEVKAKNVSIGSIGGGGRYDDLTGTFGVPGIPGVGISFGLDRIYDVLEQLNRFPETISTGSRALFFNLGEKESLRAFDLLTQLRSAGIAGEIYPENVKFDKQFKYAEKKGIPFVIIIGEKELEEGTCAVKDIRVGKQDVIPQSQLSTYTFN